MESNGHEVKVYYKGKRGEGIYDVAFEGLTVTCSAATERIIQNAKEQSMKTL